MKNFRLRWEVSKYADVTANSEEEAKEKLFNGEVEDFEDELTSPVEVIYKDFVKLN